MTCSARCWTRWCALRLICPSEVRFVECNGARAAEVAPHERRLVRNGFCERCTCVRVNTDAKQLLDAAGLDARFRVA
eukprot:4463329-Prymnesium_polylepis.1